MIHGQVVSLSTATCSSQSAIVFLDDNFVSHAELFIEHWNKFNTLGTPITW